MTTPSPNKPRLLAPSLGFVGAGRMATALARGCVDSGRWDASSVVASDPYAAARESFAKVVSGVTVTESNAEVLESSELILLAVKPQMMSEVLVDLKPHARPHHVFVSIAAGIRLQQLAAGLPAGARLVRVMPNTPCLVGLGACCFARGAHATDADAATVQQMLTSVGQVHEVQEEQLDAVTGLSGSGPAFVYTVIEALAAGGVAEGLSEELSLQLAIQTTRGAAEMLLQTGQSPEDLRKQVTSPGGTTLAGLESLAQSQGAQAFQRAVVAASRRSQELGQG